MPEIKISELTSAPVTPTGTEVFAVVQSNTTHKTTIDSLKPALVDNLSAGAPTWTTSGVLTAAGDIIAGGNGAESIALTLNDGYGNANLTFNHTGGTPDRSGSSARISSSVDSNQELLDFQLKGSVTAGSSTALTSVLKLYDDKILLLEPTKCLTPTQDDHVARKDYVDTLVDTKATTDSVTAVNQSLTNHIDATTSHTKAQVGLGSVDNTADVNKPISTATQDALNGKIGETEINTSHFTFANSTLSLNTIQEGQIGTDAVTTSKIRDYNITAKKLKGTEDIAQGDFLIYDAATGGFETTASTAQTHKLFSPNHSDVASNVTPSYGDSMYYNGTEWTTGNFGNYGADMEYMPISGASNATFTNLTWAGANSAHVGAHYDRYFSLPADGTITDISEQSTPQSGVFNPAIVNDTVQGQTSGNNGDYDPDMYVTSRVGFGSWWNAYGGDDNAHNLAGSIQFPLADLTGTGLVNGNIRGLFIRVHNWMHSSNSSQQAKLYITYPDGSKKPLSEFQRKIADGSSVYSDLNQVVLVPVNEGQTQIEIDFELNRNTSEGVEFEIVGAQCTKRVALSPDMDVIQIVGSQLSEQRAQGYVDENTSSFYNDPHVWTSVTPVLAGATNWSGVFPIEIPDNVSKSVIRVENNWNYNGSNSEEIDHITITVDWNANTIVGTYTWNAESESTGFLYSSDLVGEKTFTTEEYAGSTNSIPTVIKFELNGRSIVKLPCPSHGGTKFNIGQTYTIENYKTTAANIIDDIENDASTSSIATSQSVKEYVDHLTPKNGFKKFGTWSSRNVNSSFYRHTFYISQDDKLMTAGHGNNYNMNGQSDEYITGYTAPMIPLAKGEYVTEYYYTGAGHPSIYVLTNLKNLYASGYNGNGQLGLGDTTERQVFKKIDLPNVEFFSASHGWGDSSHAGAITTDGSLYMWGHGAQGQLGLNSTADVLSPTKVSGTGPGGIIAKKVFTYNQWSCSYYIDSDRNVRSCGYNHYGNLGTGDMAQRNVFVLPEGGRKADDIQCNSYDERMATYLVDGTTLWAAGHNAFGELGQGNTLHSNRFMEVPGVSVASLCVSHFCVFVVQTDGTLRNWGYNVQGQLGVGDTNQRTSPTEPSGNHTDVIKVISHDNYTSSWFLKSDGSIYSTGYNGYGQLGHGTTANRNTYKKVQMDNNLHFKDIESFGHSTGVQLLAVDKFNGLWGCGYNDQWSLGLNHSHAYKTVLTQLHIPS